MIHGKVSCPECDRKFAQGRGMQDHLRDKHGYDSSRAHAIANPNDKQHKGRRAARRIPPLTRPAKTSSEVDDWHPIDEGDTWE